MKPDKITEQEIQKLRAETSGTGHIIHFNNAGSSLPTDLVVDTIVDYLKEEATFGGYETEYRYRDQLDNVYTQIARLINAGKDEIAIVENASTAWLLAFNGIAFEKGDVIITSEIEYVTNLIGFLNVQKGYGVEIKVIPNDQDGRFPLQALEEAVSPKTKLIAVTHIAASTGAMMPIAEIGKIARKHQILYLVDACQTVGQVPIDVNEIGCDMLAATGRKYLRAPRGTGFLYVRKKIQDKLKLMFIDGFTATTVSLTDYMVRNDARRFEVYEKNRAITLGLGKAVEYALNIGVDKIWSRIQYLAWVMRTQLEAVDGITIHDKGDQLCGIVTFSVDGTESQVIKSKLAERQINVSVGLAKSTPYYMTKNNLNNILRASVHCYNTEGEIRIFCEALTAISRS